MMLLFSTLSKSTSSAQSNSSDIEGVSAEQYPYRLLRLRNASSRLRSAAEQKPDHAGAAYINFAWIVEWYMSSRDRPLSPWDRRILSAYNVLEQPSMVFEICSLADRRSLMRTPRTVILWTRGIQCNIGGSC